MAATASLFATSTGHVQGEAIPMGTPALQGSVAVLQGDPAPTPTTEKDRPTTVLGQWTGGAAAEMGKPAPPQPKPTPHVGRATIK
jgi:hypothetical protein